MLLVRLPAQITPSNLHRFSPDPVQTHDDPFAVLPTSPTLQGTANPDSLPTDQGSAAHPVAHPVIAINLPEAQDQAIHHQEPQYHFPNPVQSTHPPSSARPHGPKPRF